jgi:hypothetical protein
MASMAIGAIASIVGTGLAAGPFVALAAFGACMLLMALGAGLTEGVRSALHDSNQNSDGSFAARCRAGRGEVVATPTSNSRCWLIHRRPASSR